MAEELSTLAAYSADGSRVEQVWGPAREIVLDDGGVIVGRDHTSYRYDDETEDPQLLAGQPAGGPADGYDLVVEEDRSVADADGITTYDTKTVRYGYAPIVAGDGNGWILGTPTTTSVKRADGSWSVETTRYDVEGKLVEIRQPGGQALANGAGSDPKSHRIVYYTADDTAVDPSCTSRPEWAGMECRSGPAAQPLTGKPLPVTWSVGYDYLLNPTRVEERSGDVTRLMRSTADAAGRVATSSVDVLNAPSGDQPVPKVTYTYSAANGQLVAQVAGGEAIELEYDSWGQQTSYATRTSGGASNTATTTYDAAGRVKTHHDGKGLYTYTYNGVDAVGLAERRGLVTMVDVGLATGPDVFTVAYNGNGFVQKVAYPNGSVAEWTYNSGSDPVGLTYSQAGDEVLAFSAAVDRDGRIRTASSSAAVQTYQYDELDRLTRVEDHYQGECTVRDYAFDADSNRTRLTTYLPGSDGSCNTGTANQVETSVFDDAVDGQYKHNEPSKAVSQTAGSRVSDAEEADHLRTST